ncbi:MAG: hypothetical protein IT193_12995 [Propionibacteriaceae bacterium]|nr:hypothetical protein [Propionibacteriaceae bacterium]
MGIESEVLKKFLERIKGESDVPTSIPDQLATLLAEEKLPKPEHLVAVYGSSSGEPQA